MKSRIPPFIVRQLPDGNRLVLALLDFVLRRRMRHVSAGRGIRRGLWVHGVEGPIAYLRLTQEYTLAGRAGQIRCPALVCSAENDNIGVTARQLYDAQGGERAFIAFSAREGAGGHCEAGARSLFNQRIFDWLDHVLAA